MIIGNKTTLRAWAEDDLLMLSSLRNNVQLQQQLMARPRSNATSQVREWLINKNKATDVLFFIIADNTSNQAVGYLQVADIDLLNGSGRLGICISPNYQGKGYGNEAIVLLEHYLQVVWRLRKLMLEVLLTNQAAQNLYKKRGFAQCGHLREHFYMNGKYCDVVMMEKLFLL